MLLVLGVRTRDDRAARALGGEVADDVAAPRRAFATAVAGTASNPLTIASWGAIFAAASAGADAAAVPLVLGVALGSLTSVTVLAGLVAAARRAIGPRVVRVADRSPAWASSASAGRWPTRRARELTHHRARCRSMTPWPLASSVPSGSVPAKVPNGWR